MLDLCIIASLFNIFTLLTIYHERIVFSAHVNSPLGLQLSAFMIAYNTSFNQIPGSGGDCANTYDCSRQLCLLNSKYFSFNSVMMIPFPGAMSTKCSLTLYDTFVIDFNDNMAVYLTTAIGTIVSLLTAIIAKMYWPTSAIPILIYIFSCIAIYINVLMNITSLSNIEYIIPGMALYQLIYNILILVFHFIVSFCLFIKMVTLFHQEKEEEDPLIARMNLTDY